MRSPVVPSGEPAGIPSAVQERTSFCSVKRVQDSSSPERWVPVYIYISPVDIEPSANRVWPSVASLFMQF